MNRRVQSSCCYYKGQSYAVPAIVMERHDKLVCGLIMSIDGRCVKLLRY